MQLVYEICKFQGRPAKDQSLSDPVDAEVMRGVLGEDILVAFAKTVVAKSPFFPHVSSSSVAGRAAPGPMTTPMCPVPGGSYKRVTEYPTPPPPPKVQQVASDLASRRQSNDSVIRCPGARTGQLHSAGSVGRGFMRLDRQPVPRHCGPSDHQHTDAAASRTPQHCGPGGGGSHP